MPSTTRTVFSRSFTRAPILSRSMRAPVDVSIACTKTAAMVWSESRMVSICGGSTDFPEEGLEIFLPVVHGRYQRLQYSFRQKRCWSPGKHAPLDQWLHLDSSSKKQQYNTPRAGS